MDQVVGQAHPLSDSPTRTDSTKKWAEKGVDLGCGTGLSGEAFRDCVGHLTGVDLSPAMLEKARMRKCYDETVVGDCIGVLTGNGDLDLILACDVFVYIGDLEDTFIAAYSSLSKNGLFAFSTELLAGASSETEYVLHSCARFSHAISYIEKLALNSGFEICVHEVCVIRKNQGKDVQGSLSVLRRPWFYAEPTYDTTWSWILHVCFLQTFFAFLNVAAPSSGEASSMPSLCWLSDHLSLVADFEPCSH